MNKNVHLPSPIFIAVKAKTGDVVRDEKDDMLWGLTRSFARLFATQEKKKTRKKYKVLKSTEKRCPKCHNPLFKSFIKGYTYQCFFCDEDFCKFEVG